jgi:hypothetical protein
VFAYVSDPTKLATWQTNTVSAVVQDDRPLGLGTRLREVNRPPGGRQLAPLGRLTLERQFAGYCATLKQVLENS